MGLFSAFQSSLPSSDDSHLSYVLTADRLGLVPLDRVHSHVGSGRES